MGTAGKVILGLLVAGGIGIALYATLSKKSTNSPTPPPGGPEPIKGKDETKKGSGTTEPDTSSEASIRKEMDTRFGEHLTMKPGDPIYAKVNNVYLHKKPDRNLFTIVNKTKPVKKFEKIGTYGGPSIPGWSKAYVPTEQNPYLFVKTASITNQKIV